MALDFSKVKEIKIPNGNVAKITRTSDNVVLWQKGAKKTYLIQGGYLVNGTTISFVYDNDYYIEGYINRFVYIVTNGGGGYTHTFGIKNDALKLGSKIYINSVTMTSSSSSVLPFLECIVSDTTTDPIRTNAVADAGLIGDRRLYTPTSSSYDAQKISYNIPTQFQTYKGSRVFTANKFDSLRQSLAQTKVVTRIDEMYVE